MGMDIKQIQDLIKFVAKSGVNEVSIEEQDFKITIKTNQEPTFVTASVPAVLPQVAPIAAAQPAQKETAPVAATPSESQSDESRYITIKSPMIGTFYRTPSPDKDAFVNVGSVIQAGDKVCIIEAMKTFNEIESEVSGKIVKVLVDNASPVDYDQPLFLVDPA